MQSEEYKYNRQAFNQKARSMTEKFARAQASEDAGSVSHQEIQTRINPDMEKVKFTAWLVFVIPICKLFDVYF